MTKQLVCLTLLGCFGLFQTVCGQMNVKSIQNSSCDSTPCICCLDNVTCPSDGQCGGQCKDGYHGGRCLGDCPTNCKVCEDESIQMLKGYANCTSCQPGFYSTPEYFQCQFNCKAGCAECYSATNCTSCMTGYYQADTYCSKCPSECASCTTHNKCNQCIDGFYLSDVFSEYRNCTPCSVGCSNKVCDKGSGVCKCKSTIYTGDKCDQCAPNFQTYPHCNQCMAGFYGTDCNRDCPVNCNGNVCDRQSGHCTNDCNKNFIGVNCTSCIDGLHGHNCDKKCPVNCFGGVCNQADGYCHSCKSNFTGETCDSCINGQYGINCDFSCSSNCNESLCDRTTGNCDSCIYGLSGDKCCMKGIDCQSCLSDFVCSECVPGKHGDHCGKTCPETCANKICYKLNGTCISCEDGFHGDTCNISSTKPATSPGVPVAAVAGGVIGGLVVILIGLVLFIFFKRRHKNENPTSMAHTDVSTTERVYANDTASTIASNESQTYEILTRTSDTVTDYQPLNFGASLRKGETRQLSTVKTGITNTLDTSKKSNETDKLNNFPRQEKTVKPEMAVKPCKPIKAAKVSKLPPKSVEDNDYYNIETSLKKSVPVIDLAS